MPIDAKLLTLVQWLSPAFPTGAFAYAHGLEAAVAQGWVRDAESLQTWLRDVTQCGTGRSDAIWLRLGFAADALDTLDAEARAYAASATRRAEGLRQGAAFAATVRSVWQLDVPDVILPLAVGRAARLADMEVEAVVPLAVQAFLSNLVSAAQRLMPLGQSQAQGVLANLAGDIAEVADETRGATLADISNSTLMSDIAAMQQDTLEPRIFQA